MTPAVRECWYMVARLRLQKREDLAAWGVAENDGQVEWVKSLKDRKRSEELLNRPNDDDYKIQRRRLRWFGHVEREEENNWVTTSKNDMWPRSVEQRCFEENLISCVKRDMIGYGYKGGYMAQDRCAWRIITLTRASADAWDDRRKMGSRTLNEYDDADNIIMPENWKI